MADDQLLTPAEFAQRIKAQYPDYAAVPDAELATRMLDKYPEYRDRVRPADFSAPNQKDEAGNAVVAGVGKLWETINRPLLPQIAEAAHAIARHLDTPRLEHPVDPRAAFGAGAVGALGDLAAGFTSPLGIAMTIAQLGPESRIVNALPGLKALFDLPAVQALQRAVTGASGTAMAGHGAYTAVTAPTMGEKVAGLGEAAGGALGALAAAKPTIRTPVLENPNPMEAAAVEAGRAAGIPVDAAAATGNRFVRGAQHIADNSLGGSYVAGKARQAAAGALARRGGELAAEAHAEPVMPELAGEGIQQSMQSVIRDLHAHATDAYERLRAMERDPANAAEVPGMGPEQRSATQAVQQAMRQSLGHLPSDKELRELRRIQAEMDALPFKQGKLIATNPGVSSDTHYDPRAAGAPVFHDILEHAPGSSDWTRGEVREALDVALSEGRFSNAAKGALAVARKRLNGDRTISSPYLPPSAGDVAAPRQVMLMPVDIREPKQALTPLYETLKREAELVPLQGGKAKALVALDRLINGPDYAPVSIVDKAAGDLKSMARNGDMPELRTDAQGVAAAAVKHLDAAVREAVHRAGPEAVKALEDGRSATVAKFQVADVLEQLQGQGGQEPVAMYRRLTAPKDSNIKLLRQVYDMAPAGELHQIARAYLEDLLSQATAEGGFDKTGRLQAQWQQLGTETKRILFPKSGQAQALDHFFLLAKKLNETPNPSGTAHAAAIAQAMGAMWIPSLWPSMVMSQVGAAGLSKVLHSPAGVRALTQGMALQLRPGGASGAATTAAFLNLVRAARSVGVPLEEPKRR